MKKIFLLFLVIIMLSTTVLVAFAEKPNKPAKPYTNYNNDDAFEVQEANYSVSINYVKKKGFNACVSFPAPEGMTIGEIEEEYVHEIYPDATLWLWNSFSGLWISIPLELNVVLDDYDNPVCIEFIATWKDNTVINSVIGEALSGLSYYNVEGQIDCWLELAVGQWVEFNVLYPVESNRTHNDILEPPFVTVP